MYAIDELRNMVRFYSNVYESFNQRFTIEELIKIYRYHSQNEIAYNELDEFPDTWTDEQISDALNWDGVTNKRKDK